MMKLSQKRTCNSCRALAGDSCDLGKKIKSVYFEVGIIKGYMPSEPCYKPLTSNDYFTAIELIK